MMYLVLTAMLALNVAAETLQAFKIVDRSLIKTYDSFTEKNKSLLDEFRFQRDINESKVKSWYDKAEEVRRQSDSIITYLLETKRMLSVGAGGLPPVPGEEIDDAIPLIIVDNNDTIVLTTQDDLNISPQIMIREGRGKELQAKINNYRDYLIGLVGGEESIAHNLESSLDVSDPDRKDMKLAQEVGPNFRTWAQANFEATPVIASITLLSKLQIDVRNSESAVIRYLRNQIDATTYKFTSLEAKVIPVSTYVFQGQKYEAKIFLSAVDSLKQITAYVNGSGTALRVDDRGEAIYSITPSQLGVTKYKGEIVFTNPNGTEGRKAFEGEYTVAKPTATVSPTKMNVLYQNLKNPVDVSVPGVSRDNVEIEFTNGKKTKEGDLWMLEPDVLDNDGSKTKVLVYANINGSRTLMLEMKFRVKRVPDPKANVSQITSGDIQREKLGAARGVFTKMDDFDFDLSFDVVGFDLSVATSGGMTSTLNSRSNLFTPEMKALIGTLGPGAKINIENIKAKISGVPNDAPRGLSPIILTVR